MATTRAKFGRQTCFATQVRDPDRFGADFARKPGQTDPAPFLGGILEPKPPSFGIRWQGINKPNPKAALCSLTDGCIRRPSPNIVWGQSMRRTETGRERKETLKKMEHRNQQIAKCSRCLRTHIVFFFTDWWEIAGGRPYTTKASSDGKKKIQGIAVCGILRAAVSAPSWGMSTLINGTADSPTDPPPTCSWVKSKRRPEGKKATAGACSRKAGGSTGGGANGEKYGNIKSAQFWNKILTPRRLGD